MTTWLNCSYRRIGGMHWLKVGRFTIAFCISRAYRPLNQAR